MPTQTHPLATQAINTIRTLAIDMVQKANSGHPGLPLGAAPMAYVLFQRHLRFDPKHPEWPDRDRFVLSPGHGSALLYALLHLYGYELPMSEIQNFRQWQSKTPGHPEYGLTPGVEATTGPLGQGTANSVGMAMAERWLAARFNRKGAGIVDHHTYAIVSDGDLMEGIAYEAASLAGQLELGRLIWLYDANDISLDGPLSLSFDREEIAQRFTAQGWHVQHVEDGNEDLEAIDDAIEAAKKEKGKPSLIIVKTTIGYGSPAKAGSSDAHGSPLGEEELAATKKALGWESEERFYVPDKAREHFAARAAENEILREEWERDFEDYREREPELAALWEAAQGGEVPAALRKALPTFEAGKSMATRVSGGKVLNAIAEVMPWLVGGDADLSCSTKTAIEGSDDFHPRGPGRNVRFGVREHAMGAIANGMAYHGGIRPYTGTFFCFSDYMRAPMRLAALSELPVTFVFTHDSVGVGEDGPTHQPVEHLASLRAMPHLSVFRPADANETAVAWEYAVTRADGPTALVLSRQNLPTLDESAREGARRGGYVLRDASGDQPKAILIATGSEVELALAAAEQLDGVRVVSMPCWELFASQDEAYRESVLPSAVRVRVSVEAGATFGWERWVGREGVALGIDRFGASAPGGLVREQLGLNVERVVATVRELAD